VYLWRNSMAEVLNQMVALGLMEARSVASGETCWISTTYGMQAGALLVAEKKPGALATGS